MNSSDVVDGVSSIASIYQVWGSLAAVVLILICLWLCISRTRSIIFLRDRIWKFFGGSTEFSDTQMEREWCTIRDLELYRYRYGFNVDSLEQIDDLKKWIIENKIDEANLRRIPNYLDAKKRCIKDKNFSSDILLNRFFAFCIFVFIAFSLYVVNAYGDDFKVAETGKTFKFDGKKLYFDEKTISRRECSSITGKEYPDILDGSDNTEFSKYIACGLFHGEGRKFYNDSKEKNLITISLIIFGCAFSLFVISYFNGKYKIAIDIVNLVELNSLNKAVQAKSQLENKIDGIWERIDILEKQRTEGLLKLFK